MAEGEHEDGDRLHRWKGPASGVDGPIGVRRPNRRARIGDGRQVKRQPWAFWARLVDEVKGGGTDELRRILAQLPAALVRRALDDGVLQGGQGA